MLTRLQFDVGRFDCVLQLIGSGRQVVATSHQADKLQKIFAAKNLQDSKQLFFENNVDITDASALKRQELWKGVSQVVTTVGPAFGRQPDGSMG